jgi:hypothetical protein
MALSRFQFVLDFISVDCFFIPGCLSGRDNANGVRASLGENDDGHNRLENADANPMTLAAIWSPEIRT